MNHIRTRVLVGPDHRLTGTVPEDVPPGEHEAIITLAVSPPPGRPFGMQHFPSHDLGWDETARLRREDIYGDDGR